MNKIMQSAFWWCQKCYKLSILHKKVFISWVIEGDPKQTNVSSQSRTSDTTKMHLHVRFFIAFLHSIWWNFSLLLYSGEFSCKFVGCKNAQGLSWSNFLGLQTRIIFENVHRRWSSNTVSNSRILIYTRWPGGKWSEHSSNGFDQIKSSTFTDFTQKC